MAIPSRSASFILARTTDPALAAALVDQLGPDAVRTPPQVPFPAYWVKDKQRGPVALAAFAAQHCDDPTTQEAIWDKTKRQKVRLALASSEYIDPALRTKWLEELDQYENYKIYKALRTSYREHRPEILVDLVVDTLALKPIDGSNLARDLVSHPELTSEQAERIIYAAAGARVFWPAFNVIADRFGGSQVPSSLSRSTLSVPQLLNIIATRYDDPEEFRTVAAREFTSSVFNMRHARNVALSDLEAVLDIMPDFPPTPSPRTAGHEPFAFFSTEAVSRLLANPTWLRVAGHNHLDDAQFKLFLTQLDVSNVSHERLAIIQATSCSRLKAILRVFPAFGYANSDPDVWLRHAAGASARLIESVVDHCNAHSNFMTKGVEIGDKRVLPTVNYLETFRPTVALNIQDLTWNMLHAPAVDDEYVDLILWFIPGVARHVIDTDSFLADRVYCMLTEHLGTNLVLGLDLLDNEAASLEKVCKSVKRMAR